MKTRPSVIAVVGPTASGKSDVAVRLARKFNGEVVSADSRQVYKGLDIGTGKVTKREMRGIPHHLLDVVSPKKTYTAMQYKKDATKAVEAIVARGKTPIIAGGTGFYIDTLLGTVNIPEVPPDNELRKRLERQSVESLYRQLKSLDPARARTIEPDNKRRVIRAIEIAVHAKNVGRPTDVRRSKVDSSYDVLKIGIAVPEDDLKRRIEQRLYARLRRGMVAEARKLHASGLSWKRMEELGLEYRYLSRYLRRYLSRDEMIDQLNAAIRQYAKRQKRWFARDKTITWFTPQEISKIERRIGCDLPPTFRIRKV